MSFALWILYITVETALFYSQRKSGAEFIFGKAISNGQQSVQLIKVQNYWIPTFANRSLTQRVLFVF